MKRLPRHHRPHFQAFYLKEFSHSENKEREIRSLVCNSRMDVKVLLTSSRSLWSNIVIVDSTRSVPGRIVPSMGALRIVQLDILDFSTSILVRPYFHQQRVSFARLSLNRRASHGSHPRDYLPWAPCQGAFPHIERIRTAFHRTITMLQNELLRMSILGRVSYGSKLSRARCCFLLTSSFTVHRLSECNAIQLLAGDNYFP